MNMTAGLLRGLRAGHALTYYRGHIDADIARSLNGYAALLREVKETAIELQAGGRLVLSTRPAVVEFTAVTRAGEKTKHCIPITEYVAVGR